MIIDLLLSLSLLLFTLAPVSGAEALAAADYSPPPNSPLARGEHPRLFVTKQDIPVLRARILKYDKADFQRFVRHMDRLFPVAPGEGELDEWNDIIGAARSFAFLYLFDPSTLGTRGGHDREAYGRRAIALALYLAKSLPDKWRETHHGAKNLSTDKGGLASLALQVVYDWTYGLASLAERRQLTDRLVTLWDNRYDSNKVKLENHYATNVHVYAGALCFFGDTDLGPSYMAKAREMMASFEDLFLERQLGVAARLFDGSSDWVEGDSYSLDGFTGIMLMAAAAGSALQENFFVTSPWLKYAPLYFYYNIMPMPLDNEYYFSQQNTSSVSKVRDQQSSAAMNMAVCMLAKAEPALAGFASWFVHRSPYGVPVDQYDHKDPHLVDVFYRFLMGTRHVPPQAPEAAGIPLSVRLGQMDAMRSDHGTNGPTLIQFFCQKYWYANGHNEPEMGAINIHRFGPLAISAANSKNAGRRFPRVKRQGKGYILNNVLGIGGGDMRLTPDMGSMKSGGKADLPERFHEGAPEHIGSVEARESRPGAYDYINYNYTRSYKAGARTKLARRALVYLRGPVNREFVVVMDRVDSPQEKYFILHTPTAPMALDAPWAPAGQGHWQSAAHKLMVANRIGGAHGQMYITSVFPENIDVHKFGGPGHEWVWVDGTPLQYDASRFSDKAAFLLSSYTLQIRSRDNQFLTVMQLGDANTIGAPAPVQGLQGPGWIGVLLNGTRAVIFSRDESKLRALDYTMNGRQRVEHLITEVTPDTKFSVQKNGVALTRGVTSKQGTLTFADVPGGKSQYRIVIGN